ncbi:MAG: RQC domain-containing protein [Pseudomonadota bacterium]
MEHYHQEFGRAGRDGLPAECRLFWSGSDYGVWKSIIQDMEAEAGTIANEKLNRMFDFCAGVRCRHEAMIGYFDQKLDSAGCGACDICNGEVESMPDALIVGQKILSCVLRLRERFGADYTANVLTGSRESRILTAGHDRLSTYGLLSASPKRHVRDWIEQLVSQGCLAKTGDYQVLTVTEKGRRILKGQATPLLLTPAAAKATRPKPGPSRQSEADEALISALKKTRREIAEAKRIPAYVVFHDSTLNELARRRPQNLEQMLQVPGIGERKCEQYGNAFLDVIRGFSG